MENSKLYFIRGVSHRPEFNLAAEEYLLKSKGDSYISVWVNSPAVIVGINQNTAEEVNLDYTRENGIRVVRRQTGGGAVYHDGGNICYTIIDAFDSERDNYRHFTSGVIGYLKTLGVSAEFSGRNDLTIGGKKFSGNAQCVYKNRIMHHGTVMFDTDTSALTGALRPNKFKVESKGIKSVRSRVTNVSEHLADKMTAEEFFNGLCSYLSKGAEEYVLTPDDIKAIEALADGKYSSFDWNVGRSPKAEYSAEQRFTFGIVKASYSIEGGRLSAVALSGDFFSHGDVKALCESLCGLPFERSSITTALKDVGRFILGATPENIADLFFN